MGGEFRTMNEQTDKIISNENNTAANQQEFRITASGFEHVPLGMALGDYVTTSSPVFIEEPPMVLDRYFTGGQVPPIINKRIDFSITQSIDEESKQKLRQSELYFISHIADLISKYEGKFVAIVDNNVIDSDNNIDSLMVRVYTNFGYRPILMRRVSRDIARSSRLPAPKSARAR
jgi:hypothetical protein